MIRFKNLNTGCILTDAEYNELLMREYKEMYTNKTIPQAEEFGTLEEFVEYMKEHDVDTDYQEVVENTGE